MESGRRRERTRLIYHLRVFDRETGELLGHLIDLTRNGMMLLGESELEKGRKIACRMKLPGNVMVGDALEFAATVVWSKRDSDEDFCSSGLQVSDLSDSGAELIGGLIENFYQEPGEDGPDEDLSRYI